MRSQRALLAAVAAFLLAGCGGSEPAVGVPPVLPPVTPPPPSSPPILLKDIVEERLPSPYYHFEYDSTGRVTVASFASGFTRYDVTYDGDRIKALQNNTAGNQDRLEYGYDRGGQVVIITENGPDGVVRHVLFFTYDQDKLVRLEEDRRVTGGFLVEKTMTFSYLPDGNVHEITTHRPPIDGVAEMTTVDRFEQYDDKINVDDFSLLHQDFFDHLFLLPMTRLQKNNPGRVIHTGDGVNYTVDYTYMYDARRRPVTRTGDVLFQSGDQAGQRFPTLDRFGYY